MWSKHRTLLNSVTNFHMHRGFIVNVYKLGSDKKELNHFGTVPLMPKYSVGTKTRRCKTRDKNMKKANVCDKNKIKV